MPGEADVNGIHVADGVTASERYLKRLCNDSILRLWSYSSVYRDQSAHSGNAQGKEICDVLVVFGNDVIVFSDKDCAFSDRGDLRLDWQRWYRRAIKRSADQVIGAERWIRNFPHRVFLDPACSQRFPFAINPASRFHRVIVAHNAQERCKLELGGRGSLIIDSEIEGSEHLDHPFRIGWINKEAGFIHVVGDKSLDILLNTLDTAPDLLDYLVAKERLLLEQKGIRGTEEDLIALYLHKTDSTGKHAFLLPAGGYHEVDSEQWEKFSAHRQRREQLKANQVSYVWDRLIDRFSTLAQKGQLRNQDPASLTKTETIARFMAAENRTRRRMLAQALVGIIGKCVEPGMRAIRVLASDAIEHPFYVFLAMNPPPGSSYEGYRRYRETMLWNACLVAKLEHPEAKHIVGLATDGRNSHNRSEVSVRRTPGVSRVMRPSGPG